MWRRVLFFDFPCGCEGCVDERVNWGLIVHTRLSHIPFDEFLFHILPLSLSLSSFFAPPSFQSQLCVRLFFDLICATQWWEKNFGRYFFSSIPFSFLTPLEKVRGWKNFKWWSLRHGDRGDIGFVEWNPSSEMDTQMTQGIDKKSLGLTWEMDHFLFFLLYAATYAAYWELDISSERSTLFSPSIDSLFDSFLVKKVVFSCYTGMKTSCP